MQNLGLGMRQCEMYEKSHVKLRWQHTLCAATEMLLLLARMEVDASAHGCA